MSADYQEKLKHPKWQKKRLEIMQRDGWKCRQCHADDRELHVHHMKYGGEPWDVDDEFLITLCVSCHNSEHARLDIKKEALALFDRHVDLYTDGKENKMLILSWFTECFLCHMVEQDCVPNKTKKQK